MGRGRVGDVGWTNRLKSSIPHSIKPCSNATLPKNMSCPGQPPPPPSVLLERRGEGGRGSRGEPLPPCRNVFDTQHTEKLLENDLFSTWKWHFVSLKRIKIFILGQFRVPSRTNTQQTQGSGTLLIAQPNHRDVFDPYSRSNRLSQCLIEIHAADNAACGLAMPFTCYCPPLAQRCHWYTQKKCATCFSCLFHLVSLSFN